MKKKLFIISLFTTWIFIGQICIGQTATVDSLFKEFRKDIVEQEINSNQIHLDDKSRLRYYSFLQAASIDELITHMNDSSAAMRCLIFSGLVGKGANREMLVDIANEHKNDTAKVKLMWTDVVIGWTVSEYLQTHLEHSIDREEYKIDYSSRIEKITERVVVINGANHFDEIKKATLSQLDSIFCPHELLKIMSFKLYVKDRYYESESNQLTNEMKDALQKVEPNDKLHFEDIRVLIAADSTDAEEMRKVANIVLEVK